MAARPMLRRLAADDGNVSLEFLGAGVILLVPVVYLVVALAAVQAGAFAVEGAARQAARVYATASDDAAGRRGVADAVDIAFADYGLRSAPTVGITCSPRASDCLARGGSITITIAADVPLPLAPSAFGAGPLSMPVQATAVQPVSRFRPPIAP